MEFYKKPNLLIVLIISLLLNGCSKSDDIPPTISVFITNIEASSNDQVRISWDLERSTNVIITSFEIKRKHLDEKDNLTFQSIGNIPSNDSSFVDMNPPYSPEITYSIRIGYYVDQILTQGQSPEIFFIECEPKAYNRNILTFSKVPLQVEMDPNKNGIIHILDTSINDNKLVKYNSTTNSIEKTVLLGDGFDYNVVFRIVDNKYIYVTDSKGNFNKIDKETYTIEDTFKVEINEKLTSFSIDKSRIYYHDKYVLKYFDLSTRLSVNLGWGYFPRIYAYTIKDNHQLFLDRHYANVTEISVNNCPDKDNCWPEIKYTTNANSSNQPHFDPFLINWNETKDKFISSYYGDVTELETLTKKASLKSITGENYFKAVFSTDGKLYAAVQGKKLIQVFNKSYELIESIKTKLYPVFPIISPNGKLKIFGTYQPAQYSGYYYGFEFNFNGKCAIEDL